MILNELKPRKTLNKAFLLHHHSRNPNRPIGLPALWVDGGGDWDCGEGVSEGTLQVHCDTEEKRGKQLYFRAWNIIITKLKNNLMKSFILLIFSTFTIIAFSQNPKFLDLGNSEAAKSVIKFSETDYLLAGNHGVKSFFSRLDSNLDTIWTVISTDTCRFASICYDQYSGIGVTGTSSSGLRITKADESGNIVWSNDYFGDILGSGFSIVPCEGGFIVTGYVRPVIPGDPNVLIMRVDSTGTVVWEQVYDYGGLDWGRAVIKTSDGNYIIAGAAKLKLLIMKINSNGDLIFERKYGNNIVYGADDITELDDGFILSGGGGLLKISLNGDSLWYGLGGGFKIVNHANSIYGIGWEYSSGPNITMLITLNKNDLGGNFIWEKTYGYGNDNWGYAIMSKNTDELLLTGKSICHGCPDHDVIFITVDTEGILTRVRSIDPKPRKLRYYNNMFLIPDNIKGNLKLYNINGSLIGVHKIHSSTSSVRLDSNSLPAGVYVYTFVSEAIYFESGKVLIK